MEFDRKTIHGSLVSIFDVGILILGESGAGKSRLCLETIRRGHKLVADDAVELSRAGKKLKGKAPEIIFGLVEIRGIGIKDFRREFGPSSFRKESPVHFCVELAESEKVSCSTYGPKSFLDLWIPVLKLPPENATIDILEAITKDSLKQNL